MHGTNSESENLFLKLLQAANKIYKFYCSAVEEAKKRENGKIK
jgi:hypothetical protein